jgi:hypothetical protein
MAGSDLLLLSRCSELATFVAGGDRSYSYASLTHADIMTSAAAARNIGKVK